jgi:hypothetical protein
MDKIKWKDVVIVLLILGVTFGYYLDKNNFSDSRNLDFYEIESLVYYAKMKLLIIIFSLIWYFTCKHWWRSCILVILTIELLKFVSIFNTDQEQFDEIEFYTSLPITIPIVIVIFLVSKKINKYNLAKELRLELDMEIDKLFFELYQNKKSKISELNSKFNQIKMSQLESNNIDYLKNLISIRDEFYDVK